MWLIDAHNYNYGTKPSKQEELKRIKQRLKDREVNFSSLCIHDSINANARAIVILPLT